jgi:hypothetical protein
MSAWPLIVGAYSESTIDLDFNGRPRRGFRWTAIPMSGLCQASSSPLRSAAKRLHQRP